MTAGGDHDYDRHRSYRSSLIFWRPRVLEVHREAMTFLELRFRTPVLLGKKGTEYGEKQNDYRIELRIRYYFGL